MVKELHGKRYYIELNNLKELRRFKRDMKLFSNLRDEKFKIKRCKNIHGRRVWVVYSVTPCGEFKSKSRVEWNALKARISKFRKSTQVTK